MDPARLRALLSHGEGGFRVAMDLLEEHGWPPEGWDVMMEFFAETDARVPFDPIWEGLLGHLAASDYPRAVQILARIDFPRGDYRSHSRLVDVINTAHCARSAGTGGRGGPTWRDRLEYEQWELVTGETNGDLYSWNVVDDGTESVRRWTIDFAPEYMQHELEREFGHNASFKTVFYGDGGNFGPSFETGPLRDSEGLWREVRQFAAGREAECPYSGDNNDEGDRNVILEQTFCGEHPGESCALCEGGLGEEHGVIYLGELGAAVFILDVLASVTDIELVESEEGMVWELTAFAGEEEVELNEMDRRGYRRNRFDSLEAAQRFVTELGVLPNIQVHIVREDEDD